MRFWKPVRRALAVAAAIVIFGAAVPAVLAQDDPQRPAAPTAVTVVPGFAGRPAGYIAAT